MLGDFATTDAPAATITKQLALDERSEKASLNWYRANLAPRLPKSLPKLPSLEAPTLCIWSSNDHYLDGERMKISERFVKGPWRYEQIDDASHWIPLDAPDRLNQLLLEWLG